MSKHLKQNKTTTTTTKLYVASAEFCNAFDTVKKNVLRTVLLKLGIRGHMFNTLRNMWQGCLARPVLFSFLINKLASETLLRRKHGIQIHPGEIEVFLLVFDDDIT